MSVAEQAPQGIHTISFDVRGLPHPQGSMRNHVTKNGKVASRYPPGVWDWRHRVQQVAAGEMMGSPPLTSAVAVRLGFDLPRPLGHYGTGRNARVVKASAPPWPINVGSGDIDKLVRAVLDACTDAGVWQDDSLVVTLTAAKRYVPMPNRPGVHVVITELT